MGKYDGKVVINTALNNKGLEKGIGNISGSLGGLKSVVGKLGGAIAAAFSIKAIVQFGTDSSKAAMKLTDALTGLQSILDGQGRSFSSAKSFLDDYVKDGLIPMTNAAAAYKNLAMRGYDDSQIQQTLVALKNASAYGRQASLSMGEAVQSASEGLKNENSILVDNAGVTKNVAKMWDEYAKSIGTTANKLTQQQKIQAEVTGILEESKYQTGDAAKVAGTLSGQLQQLSFNFNNLKIAVGNVVNPIIQYFLPAVNSAISAVTRFANSIATVVGGIFGKAVIQTKAIADSVAEGAESQKDFADGVTEAGKAAKKSLADFDELNVLQSPDSGKGSGGSGGASSNPDISEDTIVVNNDVEDYITPKIQAIIDKIREFLAPLKEIDFSPLKESLKGLWESFKTFSDTLGEVFSWVWQNILAPLSKWVIEKAAPKSVEALTAAFEGLSSTVSVIFEAFKTLWNVLKPIFSWIGETVLVVLEDLKEIGTGIAEKWKENEPKIKETFENIGKVIEDVWAVIGPILSWIRDGLSTIAVDTPINDLQYILDLLYGISEILVGLHTFDIGKIFSGFGTLVGAELERAANSLRTYANAIGIDTDALDKKIGEWAQGRGKKFSEAWSCVEEIWGGVSTWFDTNVITPVKTAFEPIGEWFGELWSGVEKTFSDVFYNIGVFASGCWEVITIAWGSATEWFDTNIIQPVSGFFSNLWTGISTWASETWEKIKEAFAPISTWFEEKIQPLKKDFSDLWTRFREKAEEAWEKVKGAFAGIGLWAKGILNNLIRALNSGLSKIFGGINKALSKLQGIKLGDIQPFANIKPITVPQIPYLAKGAVLPPNKPFLAMVGDQRHGTNVEAPLATIQEAVALVMQDQTNAILAGFEASVGVQRDILEAVLGIQIGDDVIGNAVARYNQKRAVMRGGTL